MEFLTLMIWGVEDGVPFVPEPSTAHPEPELVIVDEEPEPSTPAAGEEKPPTPAFGVPSEVEVKEEEEEDIDEAMLDMSDKLLRITIDEPLDWTVENPFRDPTPPPPAESVPLIEYLCNLKNCTLKELHVLFHNLDERREIINHLRRNVELRTCHLKPCCKNFIVHCNDLTVQSASSVHAMGGYLSITVRGYYYIKHKVKLEHPYLPCIIEFGGGRHRSYYPLEVLSVTENKMKRCF
uniref:PAZ domain-containing protein n=1 Tax=Meloidogyne enterolobii TaxID=390850 RepID=A0A6V7VY75_MELEN|nr:unnamed protein product [Meloidogyne enterolobii]